MPGNLGGARPLGRGCFSLGRSSVEWNAVICSTAGKSGLHLPVSLAREQCLEPWSPGDEAVGEEEKRMEFPGPQNVSQHLWPLGSGGGREVTIFHSDPLSQCPGVSASCVPRAPAGTGSPHQMRTVTGLTCRWGGRAKASGTEGSQQVCCRGSWARGRWARL